MKLENTAASRIRLEAIEAEMGDLKEQIATMRTHWSRQRDLVMRLRAVKVEMEELRTEAERAQRQGEYQRAAEITWGKIPLLEKEQQTLSGEMASFKGQDAFLREEVTEEDIARVVSKWTGIPVVKMLEGESARLLHMEERLKTRVVGQDEAVSRMARAVRMSRSGLGDPHKPIGSFMFVGMTGVGKTELSRAVAEFLFDDESNMIRIDMSEYMEKHAVARLIGAPPGYVGYEEGGQLTEKVRRRPYSVVLFDEIEKAHREVFNILLQVMEDGRLTDGQGRTVDFRNTLIIMTSNVGSELLSAADDKGAAMTAVMAAMKSVFMPEFLNRIDAVIPFNPLSIENLRQIAQIQLKAAGVRMASRGIGLKWTDAALSLIAGLGYDPSYGARPLKRVVTEAVLEPVSEKIVAGEIGDGDTAALDAENGCFTWNIEKSNWKN